MSRYCDTCGIYMRLLSESKATTCCCCTVIAVQSEEHEKQLATLKAENERLENALALIVEHVACIESTNLQGLARSLGICAGIAREALSATSGESEAK